MAPGRFHVSGQVDRASFICWVRRGQTQPPYRPPDKQKGHVGRNAVNEERHEELEITEVPLPGGEDTHTL